MPYVCYCYIYRQYEERELRATQERDKRRLEFENQKNRIINRLEYERSKDTNGNFQNIYNSLVKQIDIFLLSIYLKYLGGDVIVTT